MNKAFEKIIILTQDENKSVVDRHALKHAGFASVVTLTSGLDLALELADVHVNNLKRDTLVFCQNQFEDMTALEFLNLIRMHPFLYHQPLIFIGADDHESNTFLKHGFTAVLARPFTANAVDVAVEFCLKFEQVRREKLLKFIHTKGAMPSSKAFYAKLEEYRLARKMDGSKSDAEGALYDALELMKRNQTHKALPLLVKSTSNVQCAGKAYEALAEIYEEQGEKTLAIKNKADAIKAYAFIDDNDKMLELAKEYKKSIEYPPHPISKDLGRYIAEDSLQSFVNKLALLEPFFPAGKEISALINACLLSENPEQVASELRLYLSNANFTFADDLYIAVKRKHSDRLASKEAVKNAKALKEERLQKEREQQIIDEHDKEKRVLLSKVDVENLPDFGDDLDEVPQIPLIDEGEEKVYLEKQQSSLLWSIIKSTAHAYKNMK